MIQNNVGEPNLESVISTILSHPNSFPASFLLKESLLITETERAKRSPSQPPLQLRSQKFGVRLLGNVSLPDRNTKENFFFPVFWCGCMGTGVWSCGSLPSRLSWKQKPKASFLLSHHFPGPLARRHRLFLGLFGFVPVGNSGLEASAIPCPIRIYGRH